jgi:hypothetical protein
MSRWKKPLLIALGIFGTLFLGVVVSIFFLAQTLSNHETNKRQQIQDAYSHINLPASLQLQSQKDSGDAIDSSLTVTYSYRVSVDRDTLANQIKASLEPQGFSVTPDTGPLILRARNPDLSLTFYLGQANTLEVIAGE